MSFEPPARSGIADVGEGSRRPTLFIVCGLPGSGKSTHARTLVANTGAVDLSADEWMEALGISLHDESARARVERLQWAHAQDLLRRGVSVIIQWGTWGRSERDELRIGARELGAGVELHYLTASIDTLFDRVRRRAMEDPTLTRSDIERAAATIEVPTADELALYDEGIVLEA